MIQYNMFIERVAQYIDREITSKVTGWQKWIFGAGANIAVAKADNIYKSLKDNPMLKTLDIIDGDEINIDLLYDSLVKQADKGPIQIEIPMLGSLSLNRKDVDTLYSYLNR